MVVADHLLVVVGVAHLRVVAEVADRLLGAVAEEPNSSGVEEGAGEVHLVVEGHLCYLDEC